VSEPFSFGVTQRQIVLRCAAPLRCLSFVCAGLAGSRGVTKILSWRRRVRPTQREDRENHHGTAAVNDHIPAVRQRRAELSGTDARQAFDPPPGEPKSTALPEPHTVPIFNARAAGREFSLDREGFALVAQHTEVRNFDDEDEIRRVYYPEVEAFLKATLGAERVVIFDHTVRKRVEGASDVRGAGPRQPATRVHVDQTGVSGRNRVFEHVPDEAEELVKGRVQVINLWRPLRGPLRDAPLAMCDGTTVAPGDLVASDLIYPNRSGETYSVKYNPQHRWYYVPDMTVDEALLLKCYDSATDGRTRFGPHTAFVDPTTPADAPPRESIELRTLVFHKA
jgi:hypothetical protein